MFRIGLWAGIVAASCVSPAVAQYRIDSWTTEHGLPQNSVNAIVQTRDGFLWFTTFAGLVRFDGASMRVFNPVTAPALPTSRLTELFEARDGALWIATEGRGLVRYHDRIFTTYTTSDGLPSNQIRFIFHDRDGHLLIDTTGGLVRWQEGRFVPHAGVPSSTDTDKTLLTRWRDGRIWYSDASGLHRYDNGRVTRSLPLSIRPRRGFEDRAGRLWMETQDRHIASYAGGRLTVYSAKDGVPRFTTASFAEDDRGNVWFGLRNGGGLLVFNGRTFTRFTSADGLPSDNAGVVHQDHEGTLWVATEGGLARLTDRVLTAYSTADGLAADNTFPIYQTRSGDIYIGAWRGLTRYANGVFTTVTNDFGVRDENVMAILEDRDGALWLGTWGGGVRRVKDGQVTEFRGAPPGDVVRAIYQRRNGEIWFGGAAGLSRYRDGRFAVFNRDQGFGGGEVHVIHEDRAGGLWLGTDVGLTRYHEGVFTSFGSREGLTGYAVRTIHEDGDGSLWLGTYDSGLFRLRDGRFTRFTTSEGLVSNGAFRIIEDERGWFWISSNVGLYRVSRRDLDDLAAGRVATVTSVPYNRRDGMLNPECNGGGQPAGIRASDGRIWFPTQKGVVVFDPSRVPINEQPPPVAITAVVVANVPQESSDRVEIRAGPTALELHYAALTYIRPDLSRFKYRMEGIDTEWVDARQERTARYAQLPYGVFRFRVIAANRDGVWNEQGASVDIAVVPPFWRTGWFLSLSIGVSFAIALAVHRWRMGLLQHQQELREAFSRQLIHSQELDRRRIAAGLHDGLSQSLLVIKNFALLGQAALPVEHTARARLTEIESTATQALGEVREVVHHMSAFQLERLGLAQTIGDMVATVAESSGIRFHCQIPELDGRLSKETQVNLFRIIQEAVNNVVKHSKATQAWIEMAVSDRDLRVTVVDDGRGFAAGDPMAEVTPRSGYGLFGMSERMRMLGGHLRVESSAGGGTSIRLQLPLQEATHE